MTYHVYLEETYEWILNMFGFHLLSQADSPHYSGHDQCTCQPWADMYWPMLLWHYEVAEEVNYCVIYIWPIFSQPLKQTE